MSGRRFFVINKGVAVNNEFDVRGFAVRLSAGSITGGDVVQVQVLAGENETSGSWSDLAYFGNSVQLTPTNSQLVFIVEGRYRVTYSGGNTNLQVWLEEDTIGLDKRSIATFLSANGIGNSSGLVNSITSPHNTISVADTSGDVTIDINGLPPGDNTNTLGSSAARWNALVLTKDAPIDFDDGAGNSNRIVYTDGVGPTFTDKTVSESLTFNLQKFTNSHIATLQDEDGTVAYLEDITVTPSIIAITEGGNTEIGVSGYVIERFILTSGNLTAYAISIDAPDPVVNAGRYLDGIEVHITFKGAVITLNCTGSNLAITGLALPTSATAGQEFVWTWDIATSKYIRVR